MLRILAVVALSLLLLVTAPVQAWFDGGHMVVAYVSLCADYSLTLRGAYQNLTPKTRARVDGLLKLNPMYSTWTKGVTQKRRGLVAFLRAATWPDCIKQAPCAPGYSSDGGDTPPGNTTDNQNIGYADKLMHKYWHFVDLPDSAGSPGEPPKTPNAQTEILLLAHDIGTNESDDIKSYDVAWLEHLVGDVHQPLHCTLRFTKNHPHGDAGGNFVAFCAKPCRDQLHAYWDSLLGDKLTVAQVSERGQRLLAGRKPAGADNAAPVSWITESFDLAKAVVYVPPISDDNDPSVKISPRPDAAYEEKASEVARSQGTLAGYRLAALLNLNLK